MQGYATVAAAVRVTRTGAPLVPRGPAGMFQGPRRVTMRGVASLAAAYDPTFSFMQDHWRGAM